MRTRTLGTSKMFFFKKKSKKKKNYEEKHKQINQMCASGDYTWVTKL